MAEATMPSGEHEDLSVSDVRMVIAASSAGTVFEWYDFFIYGTLAGIIGKSFFPADNATLQILLVWAGFAVGFGFRPLGAVLFGFIGDKLGRKYTFLVTVTLMGIATAGVGLVPSAASIGLAAPIIVILLRILQGLALGGEYGGAAIYVSEHAPPNRRGFYTGFIQASVVGGFVLSVIVVLACRFLIPAEAFDAWGWRMPFLLSLALLAISLWMRLKLNESPVFREMQAAGEIAGNPFVESFTYPGNKKRIFVALFGVTGGLTTIWYTAFFSSLSFLKGPMRMDETTAEIVVGLAGLVSMSFFIIFGKLSDKIGRKKPIMIGDILTLILLFPAFWMMGSFANPGLAEAARRAPVVITGTDCNYDPFASEQATPCGKLLQDLTGLGVSYEVKPATAAQAPGGLDLAIGQRDVRLDQAAGGFPWADKAARQAQLKTWLEQAGYDFAKQSPPLASLLGIGAVLLVLGALSGLTFSSVAALLSEMFPARIRYSSMSIPYHIGAGYLGGFLPLIASFIVAKTGNAYAGLWYTWVVVAIALLVGWWGLRPGPPRDFEDDVA
ncbi:MFS transporter [Novosphingobium album (ex Liu et al. 2023)]|uniref:MFS transporter n=1 Tax=Novosphingobium album (ex Liu et al. 2023) TaxID=3031130 RepID=A0ABT5WPF3_9SPHN|nr:MFS transporter [Novosphingobium album (ex Liu et al. 2023)]MDE8651922.1 MFS transporter [Novosphingobium album (ex Liu et al. 2023)]